MNQGGTYSGSPVPQQLSARWQQAGGGGGKTGEVPVTKQAFNVPAGKIVLNM